jgi:hypothetical protein
MARHNHSSDTSKVRDPVTKRAWSIDEWAAAVGLSRATTYALIKDELIPTAKVYARRLVLVSPEDFLADAAKQPLPPAVTRRLARGRGRPRLYPPLTTDQLKALADDDEATTTAP